MPMKIIGNGNKIVLNMEMLAAAVQYWLNSHMVGDAITISRVTYEGITETFEAEFKKTEPKVSK